MPINSLRAVIYTQNQSNHVCIPLCTMAECRVHPALLIVALNVALAKLLPSYLLIQWLKGLTPPLHSPRSEPRKCLHHYILSYPVQADRAQAPPVSSHISVHTGCRKQGLHNPFRELHCNTVTLWLLLGPTFESCKHCTGFTATSAEEGITSGSKKKERAPLLCLCFQ